MTRVDERLGAIPLPDGGTRFLVWAPRHDRLEVALGDRSVAMEAEGDGYHSATVPGAGPGDRYRFRLPDGTEAADPASRLQPLGVHGPSEVLDLDAWDWTDGGWSPPPLAELVLYELHVGTFTADGTFDGARERLDRAQANRRGES
jgi:maltooligosyltrehalose trehalohydrolase